MSTENPVLSMSYVEWLHEYGWIIFFVFLAIGFLLGVACDEIIIYIKTRLKNAKH